MGNASSCSCIAITSSVSIGNFNKRVKGRKTAMLLDTAGNIREIKVPVKSAELMIEVIGHVITPAEELRRTRRITALRADEELVAGKVYLLVPASRVHSKASELEMAIAEKQSGKRTAKVSPLPVSRLTERDGENEVAIFPVRPRLRWNPVLDPIFESC